MSVNEMLGYDEEINEDVEGTEENGGESSGEQGKPMTQKDINKIVEERLARERKKYADFDDLKEIAENLKKYGYEGSIKEIKEKLAIAVEASTREQELADLEEEAERHGTTPELLKEIKDLKKEIAQTKKKEQEAEEKAKKEAESKAQMEQDWNKQKTEFEETYPDIDLKELAGNKKFMKYAESANPKLTLTEVYEGYVELIGEAEAETLAKVQSKANRATHSGKGKSTAEGGTYGLTTGQQDLARKSGMTYKEYAARLKDIQ